MVSNVMSDLLHNLRRMDIQAADKVRNRGQGCYFSLGGQ
jgi:hypothetical protein